jgi:leader peptidase (prepilin peptidase)/N-methyltransferase
MHQLIGALFFIFGAIVGSFLNVVILRYNTGRKVTGRSACATCGRTLKWHELVPIVSFLAQRGRCTTCGSRISWQYPLVEFLTGVLFLGIFLKFLVPLQFFPYFILHASYLMIVVSLLVIIAVYDLRHKIIPDPFVFAFIALAGLWGAGEYLTGTLTTPLFWLLAGPILALPFAVLWVLSRGKWMGLGDAKLVWGAGWLLGLMPGVNALLLAFWSGAIISIAVLIAHSATGQRRLSQHSRQFTMKSEIPFAPFIILGVLVVLFFGFDVRVFLNL